MENPMENESNPTDFVLTVHLMIIHHWRKLSYSVKNVSAYVTCEMENNILNGFKKFISTVQ
jgi:pentose-5-phosphate-3-epimerase